MRPRCNNKSDSGPTGGDLEDVEKQPTVDTYVHRLGVKDRMECIKMKFVYREQTVKNS